MGRDEKWVEASGERSLAAGGDVKAAALGDGSHATYIEKQYVGGVAAVPIDEAVRDPRPVFDTVLSRGFTGRQWMIKQIEEFLRARNSGYLWIEAEAGMGKSALAAFLVRERGWFHHFVRYSRGETVRVGLQNLAAQLIKHYELWDLAPNNMLPERRCTPEGFETVLTRAAQAERARDPHGRVVLVVDGAEEADHEPGTLPWGLPQLLPDGVFVIGTHRTGKSLGHSDPPPTVLRINASDENNQSDLMAYLRAQAAEEVLESRLAEAGVAAEEFTSRVAAHSGGVWIYLHYVLQEVRQGQRPAGALDDLPDGLWSYYVSHLRRWESDAHWQDVLLPLLATLAAAGEPLSVTTLSDLAGVPEGRAQEWCHNRLRPFLAALSGIPRRFESGTPRRFEIYHASLREFLSGATPPPEKPEGRHSVADVLGPAVRAAHSRVAEWYLERFGGLDSGLAVLAGDPALAECDDGYPLRHLVGHLTQAGRWEDLHRLLRAERPVGQRKGVNVWFAAHDHADTLDEYFDDLAVAREECRRRADRSLAHSRPAAALAEEIHYSLMVSSLTSLTDKIPAELLRHLVAQEIWTLPRALAFARRLTSPESRAHALASLSPFVRAEQQKDVLDQALHAVSDVTNDHFRAEELVRVMEFAPDGQREALAAEAMRIASGLQNPQARARALTDLIKYLPLTDQLMAGQRALLTAGQITHEYTHAQVLIDLVKWLPASLRPDAATMALAAARNIPDDRHSGRTQAMAEVLEHLTDADRPVVAEQVLRTVGSVSTDFSRVRVLRLLAPHLSAERGQAVLELALRHATGIVNKNARVRELADLAPSLPPRLRETAMRLVLQEAAAAVTDRKTFLDRTKVLDHLPAEHLPTVMEQVLEELNTPARSYDRARMLPELLDRLPAERRRTVAKQCLEEASAIGYRHMDAWALIHLTGSAAPHDQLTVAKKALDAVMTGIDWGPTRVKALRELIENVPSELRQRVAELSLDAAASLTHPPDRAEALVGAARHLPALDRRTLVDQALDTVAAITDIRSRARTLGELFEHLPAEGARALLEQTLAAAGALTDVYDRARALAGLLAHLPAERRFALAEDALDAITDERTRALPLIMPSVLDRHLDFEDPGLLGSSQETDGFDRRTTAMLRARTRAELVEHVSAERRQTILNQALRETNAISWPMDRARILAELADHAPVEQRQGVLSMALRQVDQLRDMLARERRGLPDDLWGPVAEAARPFEEERIHTLAELLGHFPAERRHTSAEQLLPEALAVTDPKLRAETLVALLAHLPAGRLPAVAGRALQAVWGMTDEYKRAEIFRKLIPYLPGELLASGLASAVKERDVAIPALVARAGETLAATSPSGYIEFLRMATQTLSRSEHLSVLSRAAPALNQLAGPTSIALIGGSIDDVARWWP